MIRKAILAWAILVLASLLPSAESLAQSARGELKDVKAFKVKTAGFGEAATACGLDPAAAVTAFTSKLEGAGAKVVETSSGYWLLVRVTTVIRDDETCITYVETAVLQTTRYYNTATRSERVGNVEHWFDGGIVVSTRSSHSKVVLRGFRDLGAKLSQKWQSDQAS